jgi:hypothetical protein
MMTSNEASSLRAAIITEIAGRAPAGIGRTGIMKMMYFLQTLRGVDLGLSFRLYTYGPYDGQVLEDLKITESLGGVVSYSFEFQGGSGYEIKPGQSAPRIVEKAKKRLDEISDDVTWVVQEFAARPASDLEVASTAIFVDRSSDEKLSITELAKKVHAIKRHHAVARIENEIRSLNDKRLLQSIAA